jgi:hypothetical protein
LPAAATVSTPSPSYCQVLSSYSAASSSNPLNTPVEVLGQLDAGVDDVRGVRVRQHVLAEVGLPLEDLVDDPAEEGDVGAGPQWHVGVGQRARAREPGVDVVDPRAPLLLASTTHWNPTGWFSAMFEPMITMQSAFARSCWKPVAPPLPNEVPRPGTVELCHIRAWFSIWMAHRAP